MTVTIRFDDELRRKSYWAKVPASQTFEYLRDREGGIAMLKDGRGNLISCVKTKVIFPEDPVSELVESALTAPEPVMAEEEKQDSEKGA